MSEPTLNDNVLAVSRVDFNGEEWNYIVLSKDKIYDNEQNYKVQWYSKSMKFYWSKYNMSFTNAFNRFYLKVKGNIPNIVRYSHKTSIQSTIDEIKAIEEKEIREKYIQEKKQEFVNLYNEDMFSIEDLEEFLDELSI